ncbi:hypothetical protein DICPUDRAFT_100057 [Dictyostelium purpureum]|uniref:Uncharacterized protein n=1 Tax=Dictyostelium purpureum TaxID=5786 RepID=F1A534_DICPU|nr:uncharacterized protein DICPUDRAFT_100057 [Dictyostelium purpureum]EGC28693.1 hypothetical protein DICPUDRAFT_100057 [Dictyostelium purpureum]|eukprot:XP_003294778.1 hypothetical protein DICPUDRAFT_100057 [Dictyostelium purpureum]
MLTQSLSVPTSSDSIQSPIYDIHDPNALLQHQQLNSQQQSPQQTSLSNGNSVNSNINNNISNSGTNSASSSTSVTSPNTLTSTNINGSIDDIISSPKTKSKKSKSSSSSNSNSSTNSSSGNGSGILKGQKAKPSHSPLENSLNSLTKEQLVQLCTQFFEVGHPNLIQEFENAMPPPDLHEIMEELDDLQKKYNKLYPNNKFCYDNQSYNRVKSGLAAFKKALVEYGENFKEKSGWATLLQYVILAIPYALRMPLWDDEKNNASRISALSKMDVFGKAAVKGLLQNDIPLEKWERHRVSLNPHSFYLRSTIEELDKCIEKRRKKEEKHDKQSKKRKKSEPKFN